MASLYIEGYAACFDVPDDSGDIIKPGAFAESIASPRKVSMLFSHDANKVPIGVWHHAAFYEDGRGLKVEGVVTDDDIADAIREGRLHGLSIGYRKQLVRYVGESRHLLELILYEVSIVPVPMHPGAVIAHWGSKSIERRFA